MNFEPRLNIIIQRTAHHSAKKAMRNATLSNAEALGEFKEHVEKTSIESTNNMLIYVIISTLATLGVLSIWKHIKRLTKYRVKTSKNVSRSSSDDILRDQPPNENSNIRDMSSIITRNHQNVANVVSEDIYLPFLALEKVPDFGPRLSNTQLSTVEVHADPTLKKIIGSVQNVVSKMLEKI